MNLVMPADLVSLVRFYADIEDATDRFTDADVERELDYGMARYWNLIQKRLTWNYITLYEFTTTANNATYTMPMHGRTISVERQVGQRWRPVKRAEAFMADQMNVTKHRVEYSEYINGTTQHLKLHAKTIPAGHVYRLRYLAGAPRLSAGDMDDGLLFPSGWEEIPALCAAIRILAVDQEDNSLLKTQLDDAIARMDQECDNLDVYQKVTSPGMVAGGFYGDEPGEANQ